AYSILAYQIAWLKTHYPAEFMASLLSSNMGRHEDIQKYISEVKKLGITILPPNINKSVYHFSVEKIIENNVPTLAIRYGFGALKGIGEQAIKEIVREREWGGVYESIEDFVERTAHHSDIRKACLEILIKAAAFDHLFNQQNLLLNKAIYLEVSNLTSLYQKFEKKEVEETSFNLFSSEEIEAASSETIQTKGIVALSFEQDFQNEMKTFGFYFTGKIFKEIENSTGKLSTYQDVLKDNLEIGTNISVLGYISDIYISNPTSSHDSWTKPSFNRRSWGKFVLNTEQESFSFFLFSEKLAQFESLIQDGHFVFAKIKIGKNNKKDIIEYELEHLLPITENFSLRSQELHIVLENNIRSSIFDEWAKTLQELSKKDHRLDAETKIIFHLIEGTKIKCLKSATYYTVHRSKELFNLLKKDFISYYWFS
ncbi:MAG: hypothetical protein ACRCTJ_00840, partial [Brevinema sp.]